MPAGDVIPHDRQYPKLGKAKSGYLEIGFGNAPRFEAAVKG